MIKLELIKEVHPTMKQKQFKFKDSYIPSKSGIEADKIRHDLYRKYNIRIGVFSVSDYTKEELIAMQYIREGKEPPLEIQEILKSRVQTDTISNENNEFITEEEVEKILGIKL